MRVLVCGGRNYNKRLSVFGVLDRLHAKRKISMIIEGGASGADELAGEWADERKVVRKTIRADWKKHGMAAGPIRNQEMIDGWSPELIIAFPGGAGTADMSRRAEAAGIRVLHWRD
jgi:hypothetical protein